MILFTPFYGIFRRIYRAFTFARPPAPARREQLIVIEATKRIIFRTYFRRSGGHERRLRAHIITRDRILRSSRDTLEIRERVAVILR